MGFSREEVDVFLGLAQDTALGVTLEDRFSGLLESLSSLVPGLSSSIMLLPASAPPRFGFRNGQVEWLDTYLEHYRDVDPMAYTIDEASGEPTTLSQVVGSAHGSDAYSGEFLQNLGIHHVLGVTGRMPGKGRLAIAIQREKAFGDFTNHELDIMRVIVPVVCRSVHETTLRDNIAEVRRIEEDSHSGSVITNRSGEIQHADRGARGLLARFGGEGPEPVLARAALALVDDPTLAEVTQMVVLKTGASLKAKTSRVTVGSEVILLTHLEEVVNPRDLFDQRVKQFRLSARERVVAELAVRGFGNRMIGRQLGISTVTVGVHLGHIYRKVGVSGRHELTARLLLNRDF